MLAHAPDVRHVLDGGGGCVSQPQCGSRVADLTHHMACWTGQSHTSLLEGEFHPGRFQRVSGYRRRRAPSCFQCCLNISVSLSWGWVCYRLYQSVCEDQNHAAAESLSSSSSLVTYPTQHQHAEQTRSAGSSGRRPDAWEHSR